MVLDSGARQEFVTGAVRDIQEGKGRCDLLPLMIVGEIFESEGVMFGENIRDILSYIERFKKSANDKLLIIVIKRFCKMIKVEVPDMILEVAKHFEDGAKKYGENNWKKGIPIHCYIDSGVRHFLKYLKGEEDERHDRAFVWNMLCAIWTTQTYPQLFDIEEDIQKTVVHVPYKSKAKTEGGLI